MRNTAWKWKLPIGMQDCKANRRSWDGRLRFRN